jgi:hypothetical protein
VSQSRLVLRIPPNEAAMRNIAATLFLAIAIATPAEAQEVAAA